MSSSNYYTCNSLGCSSDIYKDMLCKSCYKEKVGAVKVSDSGMELDLSNVELLPGSKINYFSVPDPNKYTEQIAEAIEEVEQSNKTKHFSQGKSGVDQYPPDVFLEVGDIYTFGEGKYGRNNWTNGTDWHEFYGSALRHLFKFWNGEDIDPESGLPHLAHVIWNATALRYYQIHKLGTDDRAKFGDK